MIGAGRPAGIEPGAHPRRQTPGRALPNREVPNRTLTAKPEPGNLSWAVVGAVVAVPGDDESRRTPQHAGPDSTTTTILADQRRARSRIRAMDEHRRVCRELEQLASLVEYYTRPWWWAA